MNSSGQTSDDDTRYFVHGAFYNIDDTLALSESGLSSHGPAKTLYYQEQGMVSCVDLENKNGR